MRRWQASILLGLALCVATPAAAQELEKPAPRQGYYLGGGLYGVLDANFDDQRWYKVWPGFSVNLRAGQGLFHWLDIGLSLDFGMATGTKRQATFGGLSAEGSVHPVADLGVRVGVGFGFLAASEIEAEETDEDLGGVGDYYTLGISYDFFPFDDGASSGGLAFSPVIQLRFMPRNNFNAILGWVGVELTWWAGLPDNQLELPMEEAFGG